MKIFAVYAQINIKNKQQWLNNFREEFDNPYNLHITLKQPCIVEDTDISNIKDRLAKYIKSINYRKFEVIFSKFTFDKQEAKDNGCIMVIALQNKKILELQNNITSQLKEYSHYVEPRTRFFEENFTPHITMGRHLTLKRYKLAKSKLPPNITIKAEISKIALIIANKINAKEATNPKNLSIFKLI